MKCIDLIIPQMYGDHHTIIVRQTLIRLPGVNSVRANTARHQVQMEFDEKLLSETEILAQLESAGYSTGNGSQIIPVDKTLKDPAWARTALRMTQTHPTRT